MKTSPPAEVCNHLPMPQGTRKVFAGVNHLSQERLGTDRLPVRSMSDGNNLVHRWYRIIMGFDGNLVKHLIERLSIRASHRVLDPFCGSGTTLVECKKNGISSFGVDANPVCVFASRVKTNWRIHPGTLSALIPVFLRKAASLARRETSAKYPTLQYLSRSGMIKRGWISVHKARKLIELMNAIDTACSSPPHRNFFRLALISALVRRIADIKFGPEVYCLSERRGFHVFASFLKISRLMLGDLAEIRETQDRDVRTRVILGDSRHCDRLLALHRIDPVDFIITSPPYPNEHDYTRCTRLELAFLGHIRNNEQLRGLKRTMIRCHTKGLYRDDEDGRLAAAFDQVRDVASRLERIASNRSDGFSRLYGRLIREYFGGMVAHLRAASRSLKPNGTCAYVVSDQNSLLGIYVDTPAILKTIATSPLVGLVLRDEIIWKQRRSPGSERVLTEKILIFGKSEKSASSLARSFRR